MPEASQTAKHILLIEDDETRARVFQTALSKQGYRVDAIHTGASGYKRLHKAHDYDLVLLDTELPDVSGVDLLRHMRKTHNRYELPVILLSGLDQSDAILEGLEAGANDYLTRLGDLRVLVARVNIRLAISGHYQTRLSDERNRVVRESLGAAQHHLAQPLTAVAAQIGLLVRQAHRESNGLESQLDELHSWIFKTIEELERLGHVHQYRSVPYMDDTRILDLDWH